MRWWPLLLWMGADGGDRGWTPGGKAAAVAAMTEAMAVREPGAPIQLPAFLAEAIDRPTLVFYFSPGCGHCQRVGAEVSALHKDLSAHGAQVVGVTTANPVDVVPFRAAYGATYPILHDARRQVGAAMGARSTPSALFVRPEGGGLQVVDGWYPYLPESAAMVEARAHPGGMFGVLVAGNYVGTATCGSCHRVEHKAWSLTHHSIAWGTLIDQKATDRADCVPCHVIGHNEPGGWTPAQPHDRVDVGCEACHGASGPHDGRITNPLERCASCHDDAHSLAFSVERAMPHIDHFRNPDEETWRRAVLEMRAGRTPRPMATLPEGRTVGAATCRTCHPDHAESWDRDPHRAAMSVLPTPAEGACISCHATPQRLGGVKGAAPSEHRVDEGVGCEACHGPGEAHVADPSAKGSIQALGNDCPVCIVEAICTTCHTAEHDPDWDLDEGVKAIHPR